MLGALSAAMTAIGCNTDIHIKGFIFVYACTCTDIYMRVLRKTIMAILWSLVVHLLGVFFNIVSRGKLATLMGNGFTG